MRTLVTSIMAASSAIALGAAAYAAGDAANDESGRIEIGYLECDLRAEDGNIIVSDQLFTCRFDPAESGYSDEAYTAEISKFGLDLSKTDEETLAWAVFAPAEKYENGVLEGEYAGVSADASLGVGVGAKALVGGLEDSIALQPISLTTQEGVGVAVGIENMTLTHVGDHS